MGELRGRDDVVTVWVPKRSSGAGNQGATWRRAAT